MHIPVLHQCPLVVISSGAPQVQHAVPTVTAPIVTLALRPAWPEMKARISGIAVLILSCITAAGLFSGRSRLLVPVQPTGLSIAVYRRAHDRGMGPVYFARTVRVPTRRIPDVVRLVNRMRHITSPNEVALSCSPFRQFWQDTLTFTYTDRKPIRLQVYVGCPYVAREGSIIVGADASFVQLNYLIDRILARPSR
jgi:hypothetical protein